MGRQRADHRVSDERFIAAVATSSSICEVLTKIGVANQGGNYRVFRRRAKALQLNFSHFKGSRWNKGRTFEPKRPIEDYLTNRYPISSHRLRLRLIKEGLIEPKCSRCQLTEWLGRPIPLELDHVNGQHEDNQLTNLRLLCPNCHAGTETYRGRNRKP